MSLFALSPQSKWSIEPRSSKQKLRAPQSLPILPSPALEHRSPLKAAHLPTPVPTPMVDPGRAAQTGLLLPSTPRHPHAPWTLPGTWQCWKLQVQTTNSRRPSPDHPPVSPAYSFRAPHPAAALSPALPGHLEPPHIFSPAAHLSSFASLESAGLPHSCQNWVTVVQGPLTTVLLSSSLLRT